MAERRVALAYIENDLNGAVRRAITESGILARVDAATRVALKPNFTYPYYKPGVTTSPAVIRAAAEILSERTDHLAIVEADGGYGAWKAADAFDGHGIYAMRDEVGFEVINLGDEPSEAFEFVAGGRRRRLRLPIRLLRGTDLLITMPVPKIHCMTGLSLSYKNQWGCVPDVMRLQRHHVFDEAIVAINQALRPAVLADGTYFLDDNGPMEGHPVAMNMIIGASDTGACDWYLSELMGFPWQRVGHLRVAVERGEMPVSADQIVFNISPGEARTRIFRLRRTFRNWIALAGFKSRFLTWLGYESWFGRVVLHAVLYAIAGRPVPPAPPGVVATHR